MIVALAQINPLVGDIPGNCRRILSFHERAQGEGAGLVVFPELAVMGYPPKDLLLKSGLVEENAAALRQLAAATSAGPPMLVGFVSRNEQPIGPGLHNSLAYLAHGAVREVYHKSLLPTYDVFDELRYFEPGTKSCVVSVGEGPRSVRVGLTICEDLWNDAQTMPRQRYHRNPIEELAATDAKLMVNVSASPFLVEKNHFREKLIGTQAAAVGRPIVVVNQVGGNDDLVFDGASCVFGASGKVIARARAFDEDLLCVDLDQPSRARVEPYPDALESVWRALVLGTRDYVHKCGFKDVVLGISGGVDSALTAVIAGEALGPSRIHAVAMPSRYSSAHSLADSRALAANLGIELQVIEIEPMHAAFEAALRPGFQGKPLDTTEENVQARVRGAIIMALSNKFGWLPLTTGNKSELAVGYCTLYGDMCGGLAVISDVPKTMVYELARFANSRAGQPLIPESTMTKLPSAELRPDQHDQQTLPPYPLLDDILHHYVELEESVEQMIGAGLPEATVRKVVRWVDCNEYKRKQMATGLKVTSRAFGAGRRMPVAAKTR